MQRPSLFRAQRQLHLLGPQHRRTLRGTADRASQRPDIRGTPGSRTCSRPRRSSLRIHRCPLLGTRPSGAHPPSRAAGVKVLQVVGAPFLKDPNASEYFERRAEDTHRARATINGGRGLSVTGQASTTRGPLSCRVVPNAQEPAAGAGDPAHRAATSGAPEGIRAGIIKPTPDQHQPGTHPPPTPKPLHQAHSRYNHSHLIRRIASTAGKKRIINSRRNTPDRTGEHGGRGCNISQVSAGRGEETGGDNPIVFRGLGDMSAPAALVGRVCAVLRSIWWLVGCRWGGVAWKWCGMATYASRRGAEYWLDDERRGRNVR